MTNASRVAFIIRKLVASGYSIDAAAREVSRIYRNLCVDVIECIGSWPSSEPELAALQRQF